MTRRIGSAAGSAISRSRSVCSSQRARLAHAPLVVPKRAGQEPRLDPHPLGGAVDIVGPERLVDQLLEPLHLLRLTPQLIVEAQHLGDETGAELKREAVDARLPPRARLPGP